MSRVLFKLGIPLLLILCLLAMTACGAGGSSSGASDEQTAQPGASSSDAYGEQTAQTGASSSDASDAQTVDALYAHIGDTVLKIIPADNSSADAFIGLLTASDVTVQMSDYGGFEKVGPIGSSLPSNDASITTAPGDVILYQGDKITIYYGVNTWSFTRLGRVADTSAEELAAILGSGSVAITFSLWE